VLDKCANPDCPNAFRQLSRGKLFLVESEPESALNSRPWNRRASRRVEHYWLCDDCARVMTLSYDKTTGMTTVPLPNVMRKQPPGKASLGKTGAATQLGDRSLGRA
jgi:hypothetical protein